jgi:hypothetical protein
VFAGAGFQLLRWMEAKMREWQMMSMPQGWYLSSFDQKHYCNQLKCTHLSLIIQANICFATIPRTQWPDSCWLSCIGGTRPCWNSWVWITNANVV